MREIGRHVPCASSRTSALRLQRLQLGGVPSSKATRSHEANAGYAEGEMGEESERWRRRGERWGRRGESRNIGHVTVIK